MRPTPPVLAAVLASALWSGLPAAAEPDVVVYGATPAGVMTAVAAARQGRSVVLVEPSGHVGGVVSGGLVYTDIGKRKTVGGLADEFLKRAEAYYLESYGRGSRQFA